MGRVLNKGETLPLVLKDGAKHSRWSASASERWLACPGSVNLIDKAPPERPSPYADEGTQAHFVLESMMKMYMHPMSSRDTQRALQALRDENGTEMYNHCYDAFKEIKRRYREVEGEKVLLSETRVSLEFVATGLFGTVDAAIVEEFGTLQVIDFKYGAGVTVDPDGNSQLIYYALGLAHKYGYNFADVELVIIQPRAYSEDGPIRSWKMSLEDLMAWEEIFRQGVWDSLALDAPLAAGDHCRWCRAKPICPEISGKPLAAAKLLSPKRTIEIYELKSSDLSRLPELLDAAEKLEFWISAVKAFAHDVLEQGGPLRGWKLVEKRGTRRWIDTQAAADEADIIFGDQAFSRTLLSPAQIEKAIPSEDAASWVAENCHTVSSGLTMVRNTDKREARNTVQDDFTVIEDQIPDTKSASKARKNSYNHAPRKSAEDEFDEIEV